VLRESAKHDGHSVYLFKSRPQPAFYTTIGKLSEPRTPAGTSRRVRFTVRFEIPDRL